jgi:Family of unknown function (DUF6491)
MKRFAFAPALVGLAAVLIAGAAGAAPQASARATPQCFNKRDWRGWRATPDSKAMYIGVNSRDVYRLDFAGACPALNSGGAHLVTRSRGSNWICHPIDLDLKVADGHGAQVPCIVKAITPLAAAEAAALPKKLKP